MTQIAIIMATYNGQDGSKDQTVAIAKEYEHQFPETGFVRNFGNFVIL